MNHFLYVPIIIFVIYISWVIYLNGVPSSISDSYYVLGKKNRQLSDLFTLFCWFVSIPLLVYWIDLRPDDFDLLPFIACSSLVFVGGSPMFKRSFEGRIHKVSAILCSVSTYIWLVCYSNTLLVTFSAITLILTYIFVESNRLFWLEMIAFVTLFIAMFI